MLKLGCPMPVLEIYFIVNSNWLKIIITDRL